MEPGYAQVAPDEEEADLENGQEDGGEPISRRHAPAVLGVVNSSGGEGVDEEELGPPGDAGVGVEDSADGQYAEGVAEGRRWCKFCKVLQPLRSKHCLDCRMCCAKYDHHCFWLGTCVGERNHGKFWLYLLFQSLEIILALIVAQSAFRRNDPFDRTWATWWHNNSVVLPINFFLVCFAWFPTGLLGYHSILALTNQTTWEAFRAGSITYLKGVPRGSLPFDQGLRQNLGLFFAPPQDRLLRWRVLPQPAGRPVTWCANCVRYGCMPI